MNNFLTKLDNFINFTHTQVKKDELIFTLVFMIQKNHYYLKNKSMRVFSIT